MRIACIYREQHGTNDYGRGRPTDSMQASRKGANLAQLRYKMFSFISPQTHWTQNQNGAHMEDRSFGPWVRRFAGTMAH
jgi:hypothetical protein